MMESREEGRKIGAKTQEFIGFGDEEKKVSLKMVFSLSK